MAFEELLEWERNRQIKLKRDKERILQNYFLQKIEWNKEMVNWVKEYGSNSLKNLSITTSQADILYVYERVQRELPGFEIIPNEWLEYKVVNAEISNIPNDKAIELELQEYRNKGYNALIKNFIDDAEDKMFSAILIKNYLGRYTLIKRIDEFIKSN